MSVDELEKAIVKLTPPERARLSKLLAEMDAAEWDRQIEEDAKNGTLDRFFEGAVDDVGNGRATKL